MVKKVKGIKVSKELQEKFKFDEEGNSQLGDSAESTHALKGAVEATGSVESVGQTTLTERLSGYTFSPPHIDASAEIQIVQDLIDNAAAMYEGFLVYITNAAAGEPFVQSNKFYFCEDGEWFPSPFESVITNHAPNVNPLYEVSVPAPGTETLPFSLDLPADLFQDQDGDPLVYTATQTDGSPLPAWLSFDATSTILSGTPTESDIGLLNLTITATDPGNLSASTTQDIQIFARPMPFWAGATKEGYVSSLHTMDELIYTTGSQNNDLVFDPYSNGDYLVTAPNIVDITSGPIVIDLEFNGPLTDGMGIRWGSAAGGSYGHSRVCLGLVAPGYNTTKIWLGAGFRQNEEGSNGAYASNDASLDVQPLDVTSTDGNAYTLYSTNSYLKLTQYHRDAPTKPWQSPSDRMVQVPDIDFRIIIDGYRKSPTNNDDYIDVTILARHKTLPQSAIDDGYDLTLDDLLDYATYVSIPSKYQNCVFHRTVQSVHLNGGAATPTGDFQPFAYFYGGNHNQANFSPSFAAAAPVINSWVQTAYLPPICNYDNSITQLLYTGGTLDVTLEADFFESQNDYSKSVSYATWGTEIQYSAEMLDGSPLPAWISFNTSSKTFTFSPESSEIGFHSIKIIGTDGLGMSVETSRTYEVQQAPLPDETNPSIPTWPSPGSYIVGPGGDLTLDGQATNTWHTIEDTSKQFDLVEGVPYGDTSTALVFEWAFDGSDTANQGVRNVMSYVGFQSSDTSNEQVRYYMAAPGEDDRSTQGQKRPGNTNNTIYMSMQNPDQPADWTFRMIIKVDSWFTDGSEKPRGVKWAIAGKKNSGSLTWSDILNSTGTNVGYLETSDGFIKWGGWVNYYGTDSSAAPSEIKYHPFVSSNPQTNNNTAELHLTSPKVFFVDLDE